LIAVHAAIGGSKLVADKKLVLRQLVNKKYATINSQINITLFSLIGHILMPYLATKGIPMALKFRDVLGGDFLFGNANLENLSIKRKEALLNLKRKHIFTKEDMIKIAENFDLV